MKITTILPSLALLGASAHGAVIAIPDAVDQTVGFNINNPLGVSITGDEAIYLVGTMTFDPMELGGSFVEANMTDGGGFGPGFGNAFGQTTITIANNGTAGETTSSFVEAVPTQIAMRFNQTNGEVALWVNPNFGTTELSNTPDATNTLAAVNGSTYSTVLFRAGDFTAPNSTVDYTNFSVYYGGDSPFAPIPEPSALALLAIAGLFAGRRRR